jgi:hypothetical protein
MNMESLCADFLVERESYRGLGPSQVFENLAETIRSEWSSATDKDFQWLADALTKEPEKWFAAFLCARVETIPESLYFPLIKAGVDEPDPSFDGRFIEPCVWAFGHRRVNTTLLDIFESGTNTEKSGAVKAMYWARVLVTEHNGTYRQVITCGARVKEIRVEMSDVWERQLRLMLNEVIQNPDADVRRNIILHMPLRPGTYPSDAEEMVQKVIEIARNHPDRLVRKWIEDTLKN